MMSLLIEVIRDATLLRSRNVWKISFFRTDKLNTMRGVLE